MGVIASDSQNFNLFSLVHLSNNDSNASMKVSRSRELIKAKSDSESKQDWFNQGTSKSEMAHKPSLGSIYQSKETSKR